MKHTTTAAIFLLLLLTTACDKEPKTYTVSGRLLQDCSGAPIAGRRLRVAVSYSPDIFFGPLTDDIQSAGTGVTNAEGNFSFTINAQPGWDGFELVDEDSTANYTSQSARADGDAIALGTIYRSTTRVGTLRIEVDSTLNGTTDTLYYGTAHELHFLHPISAATVSFTFLTGVAAVTAMPDTISIYWGITRAGFDSSVAYVRRAGVNAPGARFMKLPVYQCAAGPQTGALVVRE